KHVINGLGDRTATTVNPMAFGFDPTIKPYKQDLAQAKKLLAEAGFPNGLDVGLLSTGPTVEPGLIQTTEAIVADLAKAGIRAKQRFVGEVGPFTNLVRDNKADPMFTWSWGYYSVFDADAILIDVMTCGQPYSYYCNKALDDLVIQGRSTLDSKRRTELYARAQRLIYDDAAYLYKWGLRGVWGISSRIEYEAPRDEIDRMFVVTPGSKSPRAAPGPGATGPGYPHAKLHRPPARSARGRRARHFGPCVRHPARPRRSGPPPVASECWQGRVRALPAPARPRPTAVRAVLEVPVECGPRRFRQVVVRRHAGVPAGARAHASHDLPHAGRPHGGPPDRLTTGNPGRAQAPLVAGQLLHRRGRRRPGHADLLARHHADHRLRGATQD